MNIWFICICTIHLSLKNKLQVMKYCLGLDFMIFVLIYEQLFHYSTLTLNAALATMSLINKTYKTIRGLEMIAEDRAEGWNNYRGARP